MPTHAGLLGCLSAAGKNPNARGWRSAKLQSVDSVRPGCRHGYPEGRWRCSPCRLETACDSAWA